MLRINLLPPYIYDKQKKIRLAILWMVGVAAIVVGFFFWFSGVSAKYNDAQKRDDLAKTEQTQYKDLDQKIQQVQTAVAGIQTKQGFIANAQQWNAAWPKLYDMMRNLTSDQVYLKSMALDPADHKTINIAGFSRRQLDVIRWWMILRNNHSRFSSVFFRLPPKPYDPAAKSGGTGAPGGFGSSGGSFGSSGGSFGSSGGGFGSSGGSGSSTGGFGSSGGSFGSSGGSFGSSGGSGGGAPSDALNTGPDVGPGEYLGKPVLNFTATAVLLQPLGGGTAPTWPPTAPATPAAPPRPGPPPGGRRGGD